jgi:hypothetical protein
MAESTPPPADRAIESLPGMTTREERRYLFEYARDQFVGDGEIVDLGCWLGSASAALAAGLMQNARPSAADRVVHAFDFFRYDADMASDFARAGLAGRYRQGELFLDSFRAAVEPWSSRIRPAAADLRTESWPGGPIEFLFIDAMKSWELTRGIVRGFFGSLIPGRSLVAHQDFAQFDTPWIPLLMHRLADEFAPLQHVPRSNTVVFRLERPIPPSKIERPYSYDEFSDAELEEAFRRAGELVSEDRRGGLAAARIMADVHRGRFAAAEALFGDFQRRYGGDEELAASLRREIEAPRFAALGGAGTKHERAWFFEFAKGRAAGRGAIVVVGEEGLEGIVAPLAEGLRRNPRPGAARASIRVYDPAAGGAGAPGEISPDAEAVELAVFSLGADSPAGASVANAARALAAPLRQGGATVVLLGGPLLRDWNLAAALDALLEGFDGPDYISDSSASIWTRSAPAAAAGRDRLADPAALTLREWLAAHRRLVTATLGGPEVAGWRRDPWYGEQDVLRMFEWRLFRQPVWRIEVSLDGVATAAAFRGAKGDAGEAAAWLGRRVDDWAEWAAAQLDPVLPKLQTLPFPVLDLVVEQQRTFQTSEPAQFVQLPRLDESGGVCGFLLYGALGPIDWSAKP